MFEKKDRSIVVRKDNKVKKENSEIVKKTTIALNETVYNKLLQVSKELNIIHHKNDIAIPNIAKTIEHIILNFKKKGKLSLEYISVSNKKTTIYLNKKTLDIVNNFALKYKILLGNGKINLGMTINYIVLNY